MAAKRTTADEKPSEKAHPKRDHHEKPTLTELRDLLVAKVPCGELRIRDAQRAFEAVE